MKTWAELWLAPGVYSLPHPPPEATLACRSLSIITLVEVPPLFQGGLTSVVMWVWTVGHSLLQPCCITAITLLLIGRRRGGGGRDSPALWSVPQVTWPDHVRGGEGPDSYQKNISIVLHVRYILRWTSNVERGSYLEYIFPLIKSTSIIAVICKSTVQDAVLLDSMGTFPNAIVIPVYCTWPKWLCNAQTCG